MSLIVMTYFSGSAHAAAFEVENLLNDDTQVAWAITPVTEGGKLVALDIELQFRSENLRRTDLLLPHAFAGESGFEAGIQNLKANMSFVTISDLEDPWMKAVTHNPRDLVRPAPAP